MAEIFSHPIPAVIILLGVLVLVHELGHYLVGVAFGVGVETFSIGFGPRILGFRRNGTDYRVSWLPLGGYVKFAGTLANEEVPDRFIGREMYKAAPWKRFLIVLAGPAANLLLAVFVYAVLGSSGIEHPSAVVGQVRAEGPAGKVGIQSGDKIVEINGAPVEKWDDLTELISASPGKPIQLIVDRRGQAQEFQITPETVKNEDIFGREVTKGRIGIGYGFVPPVLSITDEHGNAAKAGLHTGDEIKNISAADESFVVKNWPDLQHALAQLFDKYQTQSFSSFTFTLKDSRTVTLSVPETWNGINPNSEYLAFYDQLESSLGIADSQLTIEKVEDKAKEVLQKNDRLVSFNETEIVDIYHLQELLMDNKSPTATIGLQRDGKFISKELPLKGVEVQKPAGAEVVYTLPVAFSGASVRPDPYLEKYDNVFSAVAYGAQQTWVMSGKLVSGLAGLITGSVPLKSLGGPMLIAKVAGDSAKRGWQAFLTAMALISINLGLINLVPIPALDGGHLVMITAEVAKRGAISEEAMENYQKIGFVMILALMILATYNDLSRFWKSMLSGIAGGF